MSLILSNFVGLFVTVAVIFSLLVILSKWTGEDIASEAVYYVPLTMAAIIILPPILLGKLLKIKKDGLNALLMFFAWSVMLVSLVACLIIARAGNAIPDINRAIIIYSVLVSLYGYFIAYKGIKLLYKWTVIAPLSLFRTETNQT